MPPFEQFILFLAQSVTILIAILVGALGLVAILGRNKSKTAKIEVKKLNQRYDEMRLTLQEEIYSKAELKEAKKQKKKEKADKTTKPRVFVLKFEGDTKASAVSNLREEITAVLTLATPQDEVVVILESPGGLVHAYGLAASQLQRIRERAIPLTMIVDKVAASGGYLMACVGNRILAAPFAVIGSIGVIGQLPNFNRFLKKHNIDYEVETAGEYKRTLTLLGENTSKGREKFREQLEETHDLFQSFVQEHRPQVNLAKVSTGEYWYGKQALEHQLIDAISTSDDYLFEQSKKAELYAVEHCAKKRLSDRVSNAAGILAEKMWGRVQRSQQESQFL